jgi:cytoskeletal protein RodZ
MKRLARHRPSPAMIVAMLALVVASTGTAIAAGQMSGDNLIKKRSLSGNRLRNHSVTGTQVNLSKLGKVPSASKADLATSALSATTAATASSAKTADTATSAQTAATANSAKTADTATNAQTANTANSAKTADTATSAQTANTANSAKTADTATNAQTANTATSATTAANATELGQIPASGYTTGTGSQGGNAENLTTSTAQTTLLDITGIGQLQIACSASNVPTITMRWDATDEYVLWNNIPDSADGPLHLISSELTSTQTTLSQSFGAHGGQAIIQIAQGVDTPLPSSRTEALITLSVLPNGDTLATGCLAIGHYTVSGPNVL